MRWPQEGRLFGLWDHEDFWIRSLFRKLRRWIKNVYNFFPTSFVQSLRGRNLKVPEFSYHPTLICNNKKKMNKQKKLKKCKPMIKWCDHCYSQVEIPVLTRENSFVMPVFKGVGNAAPNIASLVSKPAWLTIFHVGAIVIAEIASMHQINATYPLWMHVVVNSVVGVEIMTHPLWFGDHQTSECNTFKNGSVQNSYVMGRRWNSKWPGRNCSNELNVLFNTVEFECQRSSALVFVWM